MNRQNFLQTMLALPAGLFLVHCSSDSDSGNTGGGLGSAGSGAGGGSAGDTSADAPAAAPAKSGTKTVYTSSTVASHSHTFTLEDSALDPPPAAGVDGDTSEAGMHTHHVTVSNDQLTQMSNGESVSITTSSAGSHVHVFTFVKIA